MAGGILMANNTRTELTKPAQTPPSMTAHAQKQAPPTPKDYTNGVFKMSAGSHCGRAGRGGGHRTPLRYSCVDIF